MWQVTYLFLYRALLDLVETVASGYVGVLDTAWMGLYQVGTRTISPLSTMANIIEAAYNGYTRQKVVWFTPIQGSAGVEVVYGQNLVFTPTDALNPENIGGAFLADAQYGGNLLMAAAYPLPGIVLSGPQNAIVAKPVFSLPTSQVYGGPDLES